MNNEQMGKLIAEQRKVKGMTQLELANRLHVTDKAVSKWERGLSSPDIGLLAQLAEELDLSVNDLLRGEKTEESAACSDSSGADVLQYAEGTVRRKYGKARLWCSVCVMLLFLVGIAVCAIVDVAISNAFTWSLYPIGSIILALCVLFPLFCFGKKGLLPAMLVLTVLIFPYLLALDRIAAAEGAVFRSGAVISVISLAFLWSVVLIMKCFGKRKLIGAGLSTILAAPACVLINASLSLTLTEEAGVFDAWDVLDIVILAVVGLALIGIDFMFGRAKKSFDTDDSSVS